MSPIKVNIYETIEISDEDRVRLGAVIDDQVKPKRQATRDEIKAWVWQHGSNWEQPLDYAWLKKFSPESLQGESEEPEEAASEPEEDLLGDSADEDLLGGESGSEDDEDLLG